jgi:hypothetical protein
MEPDSKVIWVIDGQQWPRALLRAELIERGFDAVGFETIRDGIDQLPWRRPDAIIVELRGQPEAQVRSLLKIGVPVLVTGGMPEVSAVASPPFAAVLPRPVTIGEIADRVGALV